MNSPTAGALLDYIIGKCICMLLAAKGFCGYRRYNQQWWLLQQLKAGSEVVMFKKKEQIALAPSHHVSGADRKKLGRRAVEVPSLI